MFKRRALATVGKPGGIGTQAHWAGGALVRQAGRSFSTLWDVISSKMHDHWNQDRFSADSSEAFSPSTSPNQTGGCG